MPAGLRCPGCGSSNVIEDNLYCQAQSVCADCGFVVSEGLLANEPGGGSSMNSDGLIDLFVKGPFTQIIEHAFCLSHPRLVMPTVIQLSNIIALQVKVHFKS